MYKKVVNKKSAWLYKIMKESKRNRNVRINYKYIADYFIAIFSFIMTWVETYDSNLKPIFNIYH